MASLDTIRSQTLASHEYLIVWTAILIWDWLALLPSEYRYIWKAQWTPLKIVFLLNRYGVLIGQILSTVMILATVSKELCESIFWFETAALIYATIICDVLLGIRVWALYERSRKILISLCLMLIIEFTLMVAVGSETKPVSVPPPIAAYIGLQGCLTGDYRGKHEGFAYMLSCAPFAVNSILLGMTVYKSWRITREVGTQLPILRRMITDGVGYFLVITVVNFINVYFYAQHIESIKVFNVCASVVIGSVLSCRLALSLLSNKPATVTTPFASGPQSGPHSIKPLSEPTPFVQPVNVRLNRQESDETVLEKDEEARIQGVESRSMSKSKSKEVDEEARIGKVVV